ncbi:MAG: RnfABCDGE type electron transport complex subunit B, partial [Steroidobacteraceae bacterium]
MTAEPDRQAAEPGRATAAGACTRLAQDGHDIPDGAARQQAQAAPSASAAAIDALLPQTQCTRCGHAGCRPYAEAIRRGEAEINQCPPGGAAVIG